MVLINQQVVIFDDGTEAGEATARRAAAFGAIVTLVRHVAGAQPPAWAPYHTVHLELSRSPQVDAWLDAFPAPIDHLLIGHSASPFTPEGGEVRTWPGATLQWADELARRRGPAVVQSVALFCGPVVIPAGPASATVAGEVADAYVRGLEKALRPLRVNAVWTEPVQSPLAADAPVQARQALYLSSAPHTRSQTDIGGDVAGSLLYLMNATALSGSVLRITLASPAPTEAW